MAKTKISEYDSTAANNTDIDSINIAEGMAPSNVNNAIRQLMAHLKTEFFKTGSNNTSLGDTALDSLDGTSPGGSNVAIGSGALTANTTASNNTAVGYRAGASTTTNGASVFVGQAAGQNTTGGNNTFLGVNSGDLVTSGSLNTILGRYNGNQNGLVIRTSSNNIVLSDGNGVPRFVSDSNGEFEIGGTPSRGTSNAIFKVIKRAAGNSSETFTSADMGMSDNITAMIHINIGGTTTHNHYGAAVIYWYMPRGGNSVIHQNIVTAFAGSGVTTFTRSVSGNSLVVGKDSNLPVSITVIGGGGSEDTN